MSAFDDIRKAARQSGAPGTAALVGALVVSFLVTWFLRGGISPALAFRPELALLKPWTFLTYPFASDPGAFISLLFTCWWLWWVGGALEHDLGTQRFVIFWFALTLLGSLSLLLAMLLMGSQAAFAAYGCLLPLSAVTVAWGTRNKSAIVNLWMVIPITGKWIALITAGIVFFGVGQSNPLLGAFACVPLIAAWAFADNRFSGVNYGRESIKRAAWKPSEKDDRYFDEVRKREKDREERERLRRLFEGSLKDDPEDDRGSGAR